MNVNQLLILAFFLAPFAHAMESPAGSFQNLLDISVVEPKGCDEFLDIVQSMKFKLIDFPTRHEAGHTYFGSLAVTKVGQLKAEDWERDFTRAHIDLSLKEPYPYSIYFEASNLIDFLFSDAKEMSFVFSGEIGSHIGGAFDVGVMLDLFTKRRGAGLYGHCSASGRLGKSVFVHSEDIHMTPPLLRSLRYDKSGYVPGETVKAYFTFSSPLAETKTDHIDWLFEKNGERLFFPEYKIGSFYDLEAEADGSYSISLQIPLGTRPGEYHLQSFNRKDAFGNFESTIGGHDAREGSLAKLHPLSISNRIQSFSNEKVQPSKQDYALLKAFRAINHAKTVGPADVVTEASNGQIPISIWRFISPLYAHFFPSVIKVSNGKVFVPRQEANLLYAAIGWSENEDRVVGIQMKNADIFSFISGLTETMIFYKSYAPYLKTDAAENFSRVMTAVKTFKQKGMPTVTLVAAIHGATAEYYDDQHQILKKNDVVLYEEPITKPTSKDGACAQLIRRRSSTSESGDGLTDQYAYNFAMNYFPQNFRRSDLDMRQNIFTRFFGGMLPVYNSSTYCEKMLEKQNPSALSESDRSKQNAKRHQDIAFYAANLEGYDDPKIWGDQARFVAFKREEKVLDDLSVIMRENTVNSVGILYGAGHMRRLEQALIMNGYELDTEGWMEAYGTD